MTSTEISKEVITHILKLKGEGVKYITKDLAKSIFLQLADPNKKVIVIANANNFTYITKYRSELVLIPLDKENKDFEYVLFSSGLSESKKEKVRGIWDLRKKENKSTTDGVLRQIIERHKD